MIDYLFIPACAALYAIKGGQHGRVPLIAKLRKNKIMDGVLDGKVVSPLVMALLAGPLVGAAWLAGVAPGMGRIVGNIGGYRGNWMADETPYPEELSGIYAAEGWKAGVQRGVFMGALLALATGNTAFIVLGALFPACAWLGVSVKQFTTGLRVVDWVWYEVIFGAVIGAGFIWSIAC